MGARGLKEAGGLLLRLLPWSSDAVWRTAIAVDSVIRSDKNENY
jgi:hypothetical protein